MAHRDFNAERRAVEPITFEMGYNADGTPRVFRCRRSVSPETVMAYEALDASAPLSVTLPVMDAMLKSILVEECGAMWDEARAATGDDDTVGIQEFADLAAWLVEEVVNRPTAAPAPSSAGAVNPTTGTSLTGASPSPAAVA